MSFLGNKRALIKKREIINIFLAIAVGIAVLPVIYSLAFIVREGSTFVLSLGGLLGLSGYWWLLPIVAVFGLAVGIIALQLAPETEGPGLHVVIRAFHMREGVLRLRSVPAKYLVTFFTIGWGGPSGLVGPSAHLGDATAGIFGKYARLDKEQKKTLALCGIAAAVSTLLGTPLGAAIFAVEVVYRNKLLYERLFYCFISSITATLLTYWLDIRLLKFTYVAEVPLPTPKDIGLMVATGLLVMLANLLYISLYQRIHNFFRRGSWRGHNWIEPVLGLLLGAVVIIPFYERLISLNIVGGGQIDIDKMVGLGAPALLILIVILFFSTAFISGSQGSGGLFMPVMIIGMLFGLTIATIMDVQLPHLLMIAGISAALCTTLNVPVASAIIPIELFGPVALFPSAIGALIGYIFAKRFVIYQEIEWDELKRTASE